MRVAVSRKIETKRGPMWERWSFDRYFGKPYAKHITGNMKCTYVRDLGSVWFSSDEDGNNFYKKLLADGFVRERN